ncbi:hypothetical protein [Nitratireductor alexandrii]|uniref:hypothetical protein n=1 Tax=Nitratireductor alexandrii TaxID=2448161 RepID=UPI000FDC95AA|nr:hypothetical protein [Nitratireductor alexandrii]
MSPRPETSGQRPGSGGSQERAASCEERIERHLKQRLADLRRLLDMSGVDETETLAEYGLSFDYLPPETFHDQREAYFRYQLSWGGPGDEVRFFVNPDFTCHRIEYWFLDWFDGAHRVLDGDDAVLLHEIWQWFAETGAVESEYARAQAP